jgi:aminoacrylate hydrolase
MEKRFRLPDGGELAYRVEGSGKPLLLVAGLGGQASFWDRFAERCTPHRTVIRHDHRGCGHSSRCDQPYSVATMAADLLALMDHLGLAHADIVGHSTGGAIAQRIAIDAPKRLDRIVLSATFARPCAWFRRLFHARLQVLELGGMPMYRAHSALFLNAPYWIARHDDDLERSLAAAGDGHPLDAEITRRRIHAILAHDTVDSLAQIRHACQVIVARDDMVTPVYHSEQIAQAIPDASLVVLPQGGHYLAIAEVDRYAQAVLGFLDGPLATPGPRPALVR